MYWVRFRLPFDLAPSLGMAELRRSLHTSDAKEARIRCLAATVWFRGLMEQLKQMATPTREDLERAAVDYFRWLADEVDVPRDLDPEHGDEEIAISNEHSRWVIGELDRQLKTNDFRPNVYARAERLISPLGVAFHDLDPKQQLFALQLAARAEREQTQLLIHLLTAPHRQFEGEDALFARREPESAASPPRRPLQSRRDGLLTEATAAYLANRKQLGRGASQVSELARVFDWLAEVVGPTARLGDVSKETMRHFRDDLQKVDVRLRGRKLRFVKRLTNVAEHQITHATAVRYWKSTQAFFAWAAAESLVEADPAAGLKMEKAKGEVRRSPPPFTPEELERLFRTPLYGGYASPKRVMAPGSCHRRGGHWWSGVLLMHTGMRAGELSQLLPTDFRFDEKVPHLRVTPEGDKSVKTAASEREIPITDTLLALGLRQFVEGRAKRYPKERLFREFRLGTKGRKSEGCTRFWGDLLKKEGLWKEGRSTHVWRHTFVATLRANDVAEEDVAAIVGHSRGSVTAGYGGAYPLPRKLKTLERLDFGFDVVAALGGPYDAKRHAAP